MWRRRVLPGNILNILITLRGKASMTAPVSVFRGLRTAIYAVDDIARAKEWYTKALGVEPYFDEPFYVGFNVGGYELGLDPNAGASGAGGSTAYWGVANADEALAHMLSAGATVSSPAADVGGGIRVAVVLDPFGNPIGLIENPHFDVSAAS
jgi:predicted enzyme related to lactoylglutathione lyase